jgi:hypothetical protein
MKLILRIPHCADKMHVKTKCLSCYVLEIVWKFFFFYVMDSEGFLDINFWPSLIHSTLYILQHFQHSPC